MKAHWQQFSTKVNSRTIRERGILGFCILVVIYVTFNVLFFSNSNTAKQALSLRLDAARQKIVVLEAEKLVFTTALNLDPHTEKKREIKRLEARRKELDAKLREISVGLVSAHELPQALRGLLSPLPQLRLLGLHSKAPKRLSFSNEATLNLAKDVNKQLDVAVNEVRTNAEVIDSLDGAQKVDAQSSVNQLIHQNQVRDNQISPDELGAVNDTEVAAPIALGPGVYKHSVELSIEGGYFAVLDYLKALENMPWQFYWEGMDYVVDDYPNAKVTLEVFTLSAVTAKTKVARR